MAGDFAMDVRESAQGIEIRPRGTIDETSALGAPRTGGRPVAIDCAEIHRMNSMGVAAWCRFIAELTSQGPVLLRRLSPMMVTQASMISSFVGRAQVESFISPWVCPKCDHGLELDHAYRDEVPQSTGCPKCGTAMELDWDRDAFLEFRKA
jgi:anti-anti-sigma regulatory factor/Zn ribbon nucleic-acid-binding protein